MVSFSCEVCNDTVLKKKLDQHKQRCGGAYYTCIDCSVTFNGTEYRQHTSCISEAEKYEKGLYKGKKKQQVQNKPQEVVKTESKPEPKKEKKESKKEKKSTTDLSSYLNSNKQESLYKIVKKISSEKNKDKKDILKNLKLTKLEDGSINISF
mmetsp:Transcript_2949/g.3487  ORF Transcript_2949/g.3487 Transcript_2949/m.3487 type:complete len:152 (+) Transcript_2949:829-1284(+)